MPVANRKINLLYSPVPLLLVSVCTHNNYSMHCWVSFCGFTEVMFECWHKYEDPHMNATMKGTKFLLPRMQALLDVPFTVS